jgi:predicted methyltransferase
MGETEIDLRAAVNAISDVIQNRPRPLREFDQIYMKAGDMLHQSEIVGRWADGRKLAFIGDGDAISICVTYLQRRNIFPYGPSEVIVYDFDERICNAVTRFAEKEGLDQLSAQLYNVADPFPGPTDFDCFYTNPPWGASNLGASVIAFARRGIEATGHTGEGLLVLADDPDLEWTQVVLSRVEAFILQSGFYVGEIMPRLHLYHLEDDPDLRSCDVLVKAAAGNHADSPSQPLTEAAVLDNFYGRDLPLRVRYVREKARLAYGKAHQDEYSLELMEHDSDRDH